jgi:DNA polymerase III delta subunit
MLYLITGNNTQEKDAYINQLAGQVKATQTIFVNGEELLDIAAQSDLFAPARVLIVKEPVKKLTEIVEKLDKATDTIAIVEDKLVPQDKTVIALSKLKHVKVVNLVIPTGRDLTTWVERYVTEKGGKILPEATQKLIESLGLVVTSKDPAEDFVMNRLTNELDKLITYANKEPIAQAMVVELVAETPTDAAFEILNAVAANNKSLLTKLLNDFYASSPGDEKASTILLSGLIAEQLRGMALVLVASQEGMGEPQILEQTGWKPGRLFMVKKISKYFDLKNILSALNKLEHLDKEMKSSTLSGRLLFDMIFVGLVK